MNISLHRWKDEDYQEFFNASNDEEIRKNMSDTFPKTIEQCKQIVHLFSISTDTTQYIRAIKIDNQIAGCIAAFFETDMHCKNVELAYWLSSEYRYRGIMVQIIKIIAERLFSEFDLHRLWATPFEYNIASQRVLEKAGFKYEGLLKENIFKDNQFLNSKIYALINDR